MQKNGVKSSMVAGILGVFLGWVGGHDWYLGDSKKAIMHTSLSAGGLILLMIGVILDNLSKNIPVLNVLFICLIIMAYIIFIGNLVWGMIEGIMILVQGDAGLAAKGYKVADSVAPLAMANPNENPNNTQMAAPSETGKVAAQAGEKGNVASGTAGAGTTGVAAAGSATQAGVVASAGMAESGDMAAVAAGANVTNGATAAAGVNGTDALTAASVVANEVKTGAAEGGAVAGNTTVAAVESATSIGSTGVATENAVGAGSVIGMPEKADESTVANNAGAASAGVTATGAIEGAGEATATNAAPATVTDPNGATNTTVPAGAAVQGGAAGDNVDTTRATGEAVKNDDEVKLVEPRPVVAPTPSDKEVAQAAAAAVDQANQALGK